VAHRREAAVAAARGGAPRGGDDALVLNLPGRHLRRVSAEGGRDEAAKGEGEEAEEEVS
jgi:hypothetical protein